MRPPPKASRVEDAYEQLKSDIRCNALPSGFQATEPEFALRLGMSRTPVREALIRLEAEGLVDLIPRRGARIRPIRIEDMREIYAILTSLEPDAAANVAARGLRKEDLSPLETATVDMEAALQRQDLEAWAEADDQFHLSLLELQGNRRLTDIVSALFDQAHRARVVTLKMRSLPIRSTEEHREILGYLLRGDRDAARESFRRHRQRAAVELIGILEQFNLGQL